MSQRLQEEKVFKDPVHKYIYVQDELIWNLINTSEFQRLRRIRQLGTSYLTFHGAEHSRFSHSLGVYEITRKIISQFERNAYEDWPIEERMVCLCAALLHDIGHGPFSHSFESVFGMDHEAWSRRIILGPTEVNRILSEVSERFPQQVASIIAKTYDKAIAVSLISSQMDADRMDYLLRDAYFTGVNYGMFDLERILRVVRPFRGRIVVKESGMHAVEDYLMSRYQMHWQVYFHPVTRSSEIILRKIFQRAKILVARGEGFRFWADPLSDLFVGELKVEQYLQLDEAFVQMVIMQWMKEADPVLSDLSRRFIDRRLFQYASVEMQDDPLADDLKLGLRACGVDPDYYLEIDFPADLPYDVYRPGGNEEKPPIYLLENKRLVEISDRSEIVRSISGLHQESAKIYFPADLIRKHASAFPRDVLKRLKLSEIEGGLNVD